MHGFTHVIMSYHHYVIKKLTIHNHMVYIPLIKILGHQEEGQLAI